MPIAFFIVLPSIFNISLKQINKTLITIFGLCALRGVDKPTVTIRVSLQSGGT